MRHFNHLKNMGALLSLPLLFACNSSTNPSSGGGTVPNAPKNVMGIGGLSQVSVSWTLDSSGGSAIIGYTATAVEDTSRHCTSASATSCVITGFTKRIPYTLTVTATNAVGTGMPSAPSAPVTPTIVVPDIPSYVAGQAGYSEITVYWFPPDDNGGATITSYTATAVQDNSKHCTSTSTTCVATGLANGTAYTFTVKATNLAGTGASSSPSEPVTPSVLIPDPPTDVTGTAGISLVTVSWVAPTFNGGSTITGYRASASQDTSKSCTSTTATSCVVTGLTGGISYSFTVKATNAAGTSLASSPSLFVTPTRVPDAPTGVTGIAGSAQVTVSWIAPSSNSGSVITGYTARSVQDSSKFCTSTSATSCVVTGLTDGNAYTFTVTTTNAVGSSLASLPSTPVTPLVGITWFSRSTGTTHTLYSVAWTGSQFVAVGGTTTSTTSGTILTSPDGITWTSRASGITGNLLSVTWTGTQLVAVGYSSPNAVILTSPDGITWTSRTSGVTDYGTLYSVIWTGTQLVAVGYFGTNVQSIILTSADGVTWVSRYTGATPTYLYSVAWTGSQLVTVGGTNILTSPNGLTWTSRSSGTMVGQISVTWTGSQLVSVGGSVIQTSPDAVTWTTRSSGTTNSLYCVSQAGTQIVAVGTGGAILASSDGVIWTSRTSGSTNTLRSVTLAGTQLVATGANGTILISP